MRESYYGEGKREERIVRGRGRGEEGRRGERRGRLKKGREGRGEGEKERGRGEKGEKGL